MLDPRLLRGAPNSILPVFQSSLGGTDYRFRPHYRLQSPLDKVIVKTEAGLDAFVTEKYAEEIEAILKWMEHVPPQFSARLAGHSHVPGTVDRGIQTAPGWRTRFALRIQSANLAGTLSQPFDTWARVAPPGDGLFPGEISRLTTAEFKIVSITISAESPLALHTRLRYDLVGGGTGYYREERVGYWDLDWERHREGELLVLRILHNEMKSLNSIAFRLRGRKSNPDAIGAAVTVDASNGRQVKFLQAGSGFLSQHTKEVFFGLGNSKNPVRASIRWPSGLVQHFKDLPADHRVEIEEGLEHFRVEPFLAKSQSSWELTDRRSSLPKVDLFPSAFETWLIEPLAAPEFALANLDGQIRKLSSLRGHPLLLNFWATWSPPCREELKAFEQYRDRWANHRPPLPVVAVNVNDPSEVAVVRSFVHDNKLKSLILLASEEMAGVYNLLYRYLFDRRRDLGIPTSFLLDEEGAIVKIYQGPLNPNQLWSDLDHIPRAIHESVKKALPFPGTFYGGKFQRNHFTHGVAFFRRGYLDEAVASFQLAIRDNPDYAEAHYNLGTLYLRKHMRAEARQSLDRAVQLRPDYPNALNNLGLVALEEGRAEEAIQYFQEAIRRNSSYITALHNLGNLYREKGRLAEAQRTLERALDLDPEDSEANYSLGMVLAQKNDPGRAPHFLQKAVKLRPNYPEALNNLGVLYLQTGNPAEASIVLRSAFVLRLSSTSHS